MAKNKAFSVVQICKNLSGTTLSDLGLRPVLMIGRRDSEKGPAAGCLVQISDSKASKAHLLTGLQPHPIKRQQIRGGFNFGLTATKDLVFVLDGSFRGDRCRIERVSRK